MLDEDHTQELQAAADQFVRANEHRDEEMTLSRIASEKAGTFHQVAKDAEAVLKRSIGQQIPVRVWVVRNEVVVLVRCTGDTEIIPIEL